MNITQALATLDPKNDEQWTADGLPLVNLVSELVGQPVTRKDITEAAPEFTRESAANSKGEDDAAPSDDSASDGDPADPDASDDDSDAAGDGAGPEAGVGEQPTPELDDVDASPAAEVVETTQEPQPTAEDNPHALPAHPHATVLAELKERSAALTETFNEADAVAKEAKARADTAAQELHLVNNRIEQLEKDDPHQSQRPIRDYLARQHEVRLERAGRRKAFLNGMTEDDVADAMGGRSKLDRALSQRKPARGAARPEYPRRNG